MTGKMVFHLGHSAILPRPPHEAIGLYRVLKCPGDCVSTIAHIHLGGIREHICYLPTHHLFSPEEGLRWFLSGQDWRSDPCTD